MIETALFDANIFYSAVLRDLILQLAVTDIFRGKWTEDIHNEWIEAVLKNQPHRSRQGLERTRDLMDTAIRDCLITGYQTLIPSLTLPDENDRHVLAAAIVGNCDVIVTYNLKDFPQKNLAEFGIYAQHPDDFLVNHLELNPRMFCQAVRKVRLRLKKPPYNVKNYLANLHKQRLKKTVSKLEDFADLI